MYKLVFAYNRTNLPIKDTDEHPDNTKIDRSQEVSAKFKDIILAIFEVLMIRIWVELKGFFLYSNKSTETS